MGLEQIQVELLDSMGSDRSVANAAWTSSLSKSKKEQKTDLQIESLIRDKLINWEEDEAHQTPFETVVFSFWMRHPIFNDRQQMTHRFSSQNGMSGRYRTMPTDFYELPKDVEEIIRKSYISGSDPIPLYEDACNFANEVYQDLTNLIKNAKNSEKITNDEYKRAREVIRGVQPQANMTERTMTLNLISFANFQRLRNTPGKAQPEIVYTAQKMLELVKETNICPISIKCFEELKWKVGNLIV